MPQRYKLRSYSTSDHFDGNKIVDGEISSTSSKCQNCVNLNLEIERLKQTIAILTTEESTEKHDVPVSDSSSLTEDDTTITTTSLLTVSSAPQLDLDSNDEGANTNKTETKDICCGTDGTLIVTQNIYTVGNWPQSIMI